MTTSRTKIIAEHEATETETRAGRTFPFSQPGDWVMLADIPHGPKALYVVYSGHVNYKLHGHRRCWPSQANLANILGVTEKTIRAWNKKLEAIGAIEITEVVDPRNGHKRLIVEVHQAPPPDYDGFIDYTSYYNAVADMKDTISDSLADLAADDANEPRQPPVKSTPGQGEKSTGGPDQEKHEPPVISTGGPGPESTGGQGPESTEEEEQPKESNTRRPTTTGAAEAPAVDNPQRPNSGGGDISQENRDQILAVLGKHMTERPTASKDKLVGKQVKIDIINLAFDCFRAHATVTEIDQALADRIDSNTERPYKKGTEALGLLLLSKQSPKDPLGPQAPNSWVDDTGFEYPHLRPDQRACRGASCHDVSGKRYVSIVQPSLGAFSCPICKNHYKKEAAHT